MSLRIYLAAPLSCAGRMRDIAEHFRIAGYSVGSTWHDTADSPFDPNDESTRSDIWITNRADLNLSNVLYLDTTHGVPRCAFVELGIAIEAGKRIIWMQRHDRSDRNMADAHPGCRVVTAWSSVLPALYSAEQDLTESPSGTRRVLPSLPPSSEASGHFRASTEILAGARKAGGR